jgi:galactokinase/mevalonate kinase-like predicted kinase
MYLFISDDTSAHNHIMASQLNNIRMKLEEKRRRIESEKRRMEVVMSKQRQKMGKAAFLQAVTKVSGRNQKKDIHSIQNLIHYGWQFKSKFTTRISGSRSLIFSMDNISSVQ